MDDFKIKADNALRAFAASAGKNWKAKLRQAWHNGNYRRYTGDTQVAATLQALRNLPELGFDYLAAFDLPAIPADDRAELPALDHDVMMYARFGVTPDANGMLERRIVWRLGAHLEAAGFSILGVDDRESFEKCDQIKAAMEFIFNLDEAMLMVQKPGFKRHPILLVLGNGVDLIADYGYTSGDPDGFSAAMSAFDVDTCL